MWTDFQLDCSRAVVFGLWSLVSSMNITRDLLEMQIFRPYPRPTKSESYGDWAHQAIFLISPSHYTDAPQSISTNQINNWIVL